MFAADMDKEIVYLDLSGWKPRNVSGQVRHYVNALLHDNCLFGSNFPFHLPVEWPEDPGKFDFKYEDRRKSLISNVRRLFLGWSDDLVAGAA